MIKRISILLLLAALAGCGSSDSQVLEAWLTAIEHGDIEAAAAITSTPAINWERSASLLSRNTIIGRTTVSASDIPPGAQRIQWHMANGGLEYLCSDVSVNAGKIKVWNKPLHCTEAGSYDIPK
jgi:hypothetical protein